MTGCQATNAMNATRPTRGRALQSRKSITTGSSNSTWLYGVSSGSASADATKKSASTYMNSVDFAVAWRLFQPYANTATRSAIENAHPIQFPSKTRSNDVVGKYSLYAAMPSMKFRG